MNINPIFPILFGILFGLMVAPIVIYISRKFKLSQTILHYVDKHALKNGTPTMGGIIFILTVIIGAFFFLRADFTLALIAIATMLGYGILGFLDDFIKIKFHQNEGLKPYQKIIGQVGIAMILAIFCFLSPLVGSKVSFFNLSFDMGGFYVPFIVLVFLAVTNSVNLIDGLDGLCSGTSTSYLSWFSIILILLGPMGAENANLLTVNFLMIGALIAFMAFNVFPAKIFMGDTGSLALGGFIAITGIFSGQVFLIAILGILYVLTALSDILQVAYFKKTRKRIFLMAPLHHHFEKKGVHENKIVFSYILITNLVGMIVFMICKLAI